MKVEIIRKATQRVVNFKKHFIHFEKVEAVKRVFGDKTHDALSNLEVEFTDATIYMRVDWDGRLLINPHYFKNANFTDLYLDIIHELVHVNQVITGQEFQEELPYIEKPTEIEAYQIAVDEARALGLDEKRILSYLDSDLLSNEELRQLAVTVGVNIENEELENN
ncbi:MAG: hypothetical protein ACFCUE_04920 [Candidatus Bathyarchaeia archaeon]